MDSDKVKRRGYAATPIGRQWSPPGSPPAVRKDHWQACHECGRLIPVAWDIVLPAEEVTPGRMIYAIQAMTPDDSVGTCTYVCPFCGHCHVGTPSNAPDLSAQTKCHECRADLDQSYQCPECRFPRGWMTVRCPHCGNQQPVFAPHWTSRCDEFVLECVQCECVFRSMCIC